MRRGEPGIAGSVAHAVFTGSVQVTPRQQACPAAPQAAVQVRLTGSQPNRSPLQLVPAQHGCPSSPQPLHVRLAPQVPSAPPQLAPGATHRSPEAQQASPAHLPAQQRRPGSPQGTQTPIGLPPDWVRLHVLLGERQLFCGQQSSPKKPHEAQVPPRQRLPMAVQAPPAPQQGCPTPPHAPHEPSVHIPSRAPHAVPAATQRLSTQQPPPPHRLPGQQRDPGAPHAAP